MEHSNTFVHLQFSLTKIRKLLINSVFYDLIRSGGLRIAYLSHHKKKIHDSDITHI